MSIEKNTKIIYNETPSTKYSNGAFGSINGNGDFAINFFIDRPKNYDSFILKIDEKTNQVNQIFNGEEAIREVHTQLILNVNAAKSIAEWILSNVKAYEDMISSVSKE